MWGKAAIDLSWAVGLSRELIITSGERRSFFSTQSPVASRPSYNLILPWMPGGTLDATLSTRPIRAPDIIHWLHVLCVVTIVMNKPL